MPDHENCTSLFTCFFPINEELTIPFHEITNEQNCKSTKVDAHENL